MNGWLILDKPLGITSAHAVAKVKRLLKPSKIGHAGTLDPMASGILPLALGEATKVIQYMVASEKAYGFTVKWGEKRDTDDSEGVTIATSPNRPQLSEIQAILSEFTGTILQMPPDYSAIKVGGRRSYDAARAGEALELKAREVRVDRLMIYPSPLVGEGGERGVSPQSHALMVSPLPNPLPQGERGLIKGSPPQGEREHVEETSFFCECGKGTYIRSLARDMGDRLGCLGYVTVLRRLKVGKFTENHAISLETLEKMVHNNALGFLLPVESVLDDIPALEISSNQAVLLKRGQAISVQTPVQGDVVYARFEGKPVAICNLSQGMMKPVRVFNL